MSLSPDNVGAHLTVLQTAETTLLRTDNFVAISRMQMHQLKAVYEHPVLLAKKRLEFKNL